MTALETSTKTLSIEIPLVVAGVIAAHWSCGCYSAVPRGFGRAERGHSIIDGNDQWVCGWQTKEVDGVKRLGVLVQMQKNHFGGDQSDKSVTRYFFPQEGLRRVRFEAEGVEL